MSNTPEIMQNPLTDKGTAFTLEERERYGLTGRLPAAVETRSGLQRQRRT